MAKQRRPSPARNSGRGGKEHGPLKPGFWRGRTLEELSQREWEALCDGCGKCCLHKLEDEDSGEIYYTRVACRLLDLATCRCSDYAHRTRRVPGCLKLRDGFAEYHWLPRNCTYRLLAEGEELPDWHPLVTGRPESVHEAGRSVRHFAIPEDEAGDPEDHVIEDCE